MIEQETPTSYKQSATAAAPSKYEDLDDYYDTLSDFSTVLGGGGGGGRGREEDEREVEEILDPKTAAIRR